MRFFGYFSILSLLVLTSCSEKEKIFLAQGIMSGEATENSIILQARLTSADTLIAGDIPGAAGFGKFEVSENSGFNPSGFSGLMKADAAKDHILKCRFEGLKPGTRYHFRLHYGSSEKTGQISDPATFKTNLGKSMEGESSFAVVTGMNYYHFHYGKYDRKLAYSGADKHLGYPALKAILDFRPDYFIGTGDNVYFDHPSARNFKNSIDRGKDPHPGGYEGKEVIDETGMRRKYHEQFFQPRFKDLFKNVATYWEKDDHDYRVNDADPFTDFPIAHHLGIKNFKEQVPVADPEHGGKTYRTRRINRDLQLWFVEGRDYRDANASPDGPDKTLWGKAQLSWLQSTLLESDATFKILVSPTPMVGPDDASKRDNHVNPMGFKHEGEAFFDWIVENNLLSKNFYIICGDRHWQYHARHPKGIEEFSCGALVDNNSRAGRLAGDPDSTDPEGKIVQYYIQGTEEQASGGFLLVKNTSGDPPELHFDFYNETGKLLYNTVKKAK
ncbi:MAG: metallophosphoesterase family protein [Cytophagales bacterium]|nr:metallophosphoesterase family protein [Cytophagales bacterium]